MTVREQEASDPSGTRTALIDAAILIMREEGYAAVTSRRIAERAGLKSKLVHYYFKSMDELFLAVCHRAEEQYVARQAKAIASRNPLRALWEFSTDIASNSVVLELIAMSNNRKSIPPEIARASERNRTIHAAIFERALQDSGMDTALFPPAFLSLMMTALSRLFAMDKALGVTGGHREADICIEQFLRRLEAGDGDAAARDGTS